MIRLQSPVVQIARALVLMAALTTVQPGYTRELGVGMAGVTEEELTTFATSFRSAIESGNLQQVEHHIWFPLRVNTGPGQFRLVNQAEFISEYRKVFSPGVRAAILAQDAATLQKLWRGNSAESIVSVAAICPWGSCAKPSPRVTAVNLNQKQGAPKAE